MKRSIISDTAHYLPNHKVTTKQVEGIIQKKSHIHISLGLIETLLGTKTRYRTKDHEYSSTLAIEAIKKLQEKNPKILNDIDLFIYASATQDCIEPSTACIIMDSFYLTCPSFDIQNACNSVMSALDIANTYIVSGKYKKILICSGETPSKSIKFTHNNKESFKESFSSFGLGDAGIALIIESKENTGGILFSEAITNGEHRQEAAILGGGSRYPHCVEHNYFIGNPSSLKDFFTTKGHILIQKGYQKTGWKPEDIENVFIHQASHNSYYTAIDMLKIPEEKFIKTYESYGNIASCTIPLQLSLHGLHQGKKYMILGLGAGATFRCIFYQH